MGCEHRTEEFRRESDHECPAGGCHGEKNLAEIFSEEAISNLGLEEVEFDEPSSVWSVTLGFSRPWDLSRGAVAAIVGQGRREYKIVRIDDRTEKLLSIKNREPINAE